MTRAHLATRKRFSQNAWRVPQHFIYLERESSLFSRRYARARVFSTSGWAPVETVSNGAILTPVTHRGGEGASLEDGISRRPRCRFSWGNANEPSRISSPSLFLLSLSLSSARRSSAVCSNCRACVLSAAQTINESDEKRRNLNALTTCVPIYATIELHSPSLSLLCVSFRIFGHYYWVSVWALKKFASLIFVRSLRNNNSIHLYSASLCTHMLFV